MVQTTSATSEECAAASEELSNLAARMHDLLSSYNLGTGSGISSAKAMDYAAPAANDNEQIISLGDSFGKY